jgi:prepilin-type N-terminal cleavage/methylation domain-containing protein/prepilin-type processing-associated H-X9-DG protein
MQAPQRRGQPARGFTLIELLVVIAIISLLMSILMPSLARARQMARAVTCRGLLKQWGFIWYMYCDDNNGYFSSGTNVNWPRGEWVLALRRHYQTRSKILVCPTAPKRRPDGAEYGGPYNTYVMGTDASQDVPEEASYGQNNWLFNPPSSVTAIQGRPAAWHWRTTNVKQAAQIPVSADTMWRGGGPYVSGDGGDPPECNGQWVSAASEMKHFCIDRHNGAVNQLFLDWSIRPVGLKELWTLKWHKLFDTRGPWTKAGGVETNDWPQWMRGFKDY